MSNTNRTPGRPSFLAAAAAAFTAALIATPASAQTVLHACYVPASGTVYRIKATNTPQNCLQPTHVAFSWTDGAEAAAALQNAVKKTDIAAGDVTGVFTSLTVGKLLGRTLGATPPTDGQLLAWNATTNAWEPKTIAAGGGGGTSDHGGLTGLGDDDHAQYLIVNGVRAGGFGVRSPLGATASLFPTLEDGESGFLWNAARGALRIGLGTGSNTDWSAASLGQGSFGAGRAVKATGTGAMALGLGAEAVADGAVAIGRIPEATAPDAVAIGNNAKATGQSSSAFGLNSKASASLSVAIAGGDASATLAMAVGGTASGDASVSVGSGSLANAANATAIRGTASGINALALGGTASGELAVALRGTASGARSHSIGSRANTNGKAGAVVVAAGVGGFVNAAADNQFVVGASHIFLTNYSVSPVVTAGRFLETSTGAYLTTGGAWTNSSDSTVKTAFAAVDGDSVLTKIAALPVYTWQYKTEDSTTRHMGPTAQAFRKSFGLGDTDKAISTVDIDGVSLAGVKALESRTRTLKAETIALRRENSELAARLSQLEALVANLTANGATARNR